MNGLWFALFVGLVIYLFIKKKKKFDQSEAAGNTTSGENTEEANEANLMRITNKVGRHFMTRSYDAAIKLINENINNYQGEQKAQLLNQRGGIYSIKGDNEAAYNDFKEAYGLDNNVTNLTNFVEVLVKTKRVDEAKPIAEQGLKNPNLSSSDKKTLTEALNG